MNSILLFLLLKHAPQKNKELFNFRLISVRRCFLVQFKFISIVISEKNGEKSVVLEAKNLKREQEKSHNDSLLRYIYMTVHRSRLNKIVSYIIFL